MLRRLYSKFGMKGKAHASYFVRILETAFIVDRFLFYGVPQGSLVGPNIVPITNVPTGRFNEETRYVVPPISK